MTTIVLTEVKETKIAKKVSNDYKNIFALWHKVFATLNTGEDLYFGRVIQRRSRLPREDFG